MLKIDSTGKECDKHDSANGNVKQQPDNESLAHKTIKAGQQIQRVSKDNGTPSPNNSNGERHGKGDGLGTEESKGNTRNKRNRRKGKGGKHHHKKWKPYTKLTWEEKKAVDERESIRAHLKREERFSLGQPMAPYNTTQFLMDQHPASDLESHFKAQESDVQVSFQRTVSRVSGEGSASLDSSEDYYSSPDDEEEFLQREFSEEYDTFHAERLQSMSKDELVKEYLELESKVERLEQRHHDSKSAVKNTEEESMDTFVTSTSTFEEDFKKLKAENERLRRENEVLRTGLLNNVNSDNKENTPLSPQSV